MSAVERAEALLRQGYLGRALAALGTTKGFRADLVRIQALSENDPAGALPAIRKRARTLAHSDDDLARYLMTIGRLAEWQRGTVSESHQQKAYEVAKSAALKARAAVDLGRARTSRGDLDGAALWLARADMLTVEGAVAGHREHLRAIIELYTGRNDEAVASFSRAMTLAGRDDVMLRCRGLRGRGRAFAALGRRQTGVDDYERCVELCTRRDGMTAMRSHSLNALADFAREDGDFDRAIALYTQSLQTGNTHVRHVVHLNLALLELSKGNLAAARAHLGSVDYRVADRPFVMLAGSGTELAISSHDASDEVLSALITEFELAVELAGNLDSQSLEVLSEALAVLQARGVSPVVQARVTRIALRHAQALLHDSEDQLVAALVAHDIQLVGPYQLVGRLGDGASGSVFEAVDTTTGQRVAVKVLEEDTIADRVADIELGAVARLEHPGIVRVLDHGTVQPSESPTTGWRSGVPWIAMELVQGGSVQGTRWTPQALIPFLHHLLDALAHAHARGVFHLDLKPANVMLDASGHPILVDFGIAALVGTDRRMKAGTPAYCAPEQLSAAHRQLGPWTDLYALACTAWELLTGRPPFPGTNALSLRRAHLFQQPPELDVGHPELESWLRSLLGKAPADRFSTAPQAARVLARCAAPPPRRQAHRPTTASLAAVVRRVPQPVARAEERARLAQAMEQCLADRAAAHVVLHGSPGDGLSHLARDLAYHVLESGSARVLWASGGNLRAALRHCLQGAGLSGDALARHLDKRPEVRDASRLAPWIEGEGELTEGLAELLYRGPWLVVRDDPGAPYSDPLPIGPIMLLDVCHQPQPGGLRVPPMSRAELQEMLDAWVPLETTLCDQLTDRCRSPSQVIGTVRGLAARHRLLPGAHHLSARQGRLPELPTLLRAMLESRLSAEDRQALQALDGKVWVPDAESPPRPALARLAGLGFARRGLGGWMLWRGLPLH